MKKLTLIEAIILTMVLSVTVYGATITFTIDDAFLPRVVNATKGLYPIPQTCDELGNCTPDFTDNQWAKESLRRRIKSDVERWETKQTRQAVNVTVNDTDVQ